MCLFRYLAPMASGLLAGIQSILVSLTSTGALESTATVQSIITILRILKAGVLSYLVIHVGVNAAREFKTDINLGWCAGRCGSAHRYVRRQPLVTSSPVSHSSPVRAV